MEKDYTFHTQISREMYNTLMNSKVTAVYPKFGISCKASTDKAERALINHLGYNFFFGWEDIYTKVQELKGELKFTEDNNSKYVLLELKVNKDSIIRTNYYNYGYLIYAFDWMEEGEDENSPHFLKEIESLFGKGATIQSLIEDIFKVDEKNLVQILFKELRKEDIVYVKNLTNILV